MDEDVLEEKLRALHSAGFGWALACCGYRRDEAEDVMQTVYLKIIEGRARFNGASSFKTWLFGVIRITAREKRRHGLRERLGLARFGMQKASFVSAPAEDSETGHDDASRLRAALRGLPARQREILELVFYHELSVENAAAIMNVSVGTARTHYERGKQRLRQTLRAERNE